MKQDITTIVRDIMIEFADLTGLSPEAPLPRRYLWTDAFAVCNFLELFHRTTDEKYRHLALSLVEQVHNTLGRHRKDDPRAGWISGLDEQEGKRHPTKGGLRIGKKMNERKSSDLFDESLEWDRDGQYYHYLTKWMHALDCVSRVTADPTFSIWAIELAKTAHSAFTHVPSTGGQKRLYWKMSIDLSWPLVPSMGHHDPLDGFIIYNQIKTTALQYSEKSLQPDISAEIADMAYICEGKSWATDDPLGLGDLLCNAFKVAQLIINADFEQTGLLDILLDASLKGLKVFAGRNPLGLPAAYRLAFRELGLSIGLRAAQKCKKLIEQTPGLFKKTDLLHARLEAVIKHASVGEQIEMFWLDRSNREAESWKAHREINMVMLATSLAPDAYLTV